MLNKVMLS